MDIKQISEIEQQFLSDIKECNQSNLLEELRIKYLGKKGLVTETAKLISSIPVDQKKEFGSQINKLKNYITEQINLLRDKISNQELEAQLIAESVDVTLPIRPDNKATIHPISYVISEINDILSKMDFIYTTGSDIENDYYNFSALNIPDHHPAREMQDTFYIDKKYNDDKNKFLLRTHTSSVQIRTMEKNSPPLRIFSTGRVYRSDYDATHSPMFHQVEGLCIEKDINMGHLKGCIKRFLEEFFEVDDIPLRFRPSFFPFTEPSAEVDIGYTKRPDGSIQIGGNENWLEILGCGMVHPKVLENVNIDSKKYTGFAFGIGVERIAMLKYGVPDLRSFFVNDLRWLSHYGFSPFK